MLHVFSARDRRLIARFLQPTTGDFCLFFWSLRLTFSAKSAILELKEGGNEIFLVYDVQEGDIFHLYEKTISVTGSL